MKNIEQVSQYNQSQLIANNDLVSIHLSNALSPKPLTFRDDHKHIASNILGNTSLTCQQKHTNAQQSSVLNKRMNMNAEGWLKALQTSLVKPSLVDAIVA